MTYRKKLIEVALPLEAINKAAAREKSIRHGHPSTLHLWWARRPLAACRAVLFASLVDDPDSDPMFAGDEDLAASKRAELFNLIEELVLWENSNNSRLINRARAEIARCVATQKIEEGVFRKDDVLSLPSPTARGTGGEGGAKAEGGARKAEKIKAPVFEIRQLLAKPEQVNAFLAEHAPPVLDPFCGGGSIPLEAQRLGLRAYASDLNPVPVLINKALIEIPARFAGRPPVNPEWQTKSKEEHAATVWQGAQGLATDVRYYGKWMRDEAEKRVGHLYPKVKVTKEMARGRPDLKEYVGRELTVIAWLWARTVASPSPAFQGVHVPLVSSFWLGTKPKQNAWLQPDRDRNRKSYHFYVRVGTPSAADKRWIDAGTKLGRGCKFRCLLSDEPIPEEHIKSEGMAGRLGTSLLALVADGTSGRVYLPRIAAGCGSAQPNDRNLDIASIDTPIALDKRAIWCLLYGLTSFDRLFTPRQLLALTTFADLIVDARERIVHDVLQTKCSGDVFTPADYGNAVATYLGLGISKATDYNSNLVSWITPRNQARNTFARQGLPMVWDFCEVNPFAGAAGDPAVSLDGIADVLERMFQGNPGHVRQLDATASLEGVECPLISTDPPYYDNIGYADLSDFFYVWLRRCLAGAYPTLFSTVLTPKEAELIASPYRHDGRKEAAQAFFEEGLGKAFARMHEAQSAKFPLTVFYAFKQAETEESVDEDDLAHSSGTVSTGWETMLTGLIRAGFGIHGTWPMRTERGARSVGLGTNALASSIVLVCRPRRQDAPLSTRKNFIALLRKELPEALRDLQRGNIAPVDLAQASIGPGMAVFTRHAKVMETDGSPMTVRTALGLINQALDEVLAEQEGEFDADTRWALAWFEQFGTAEGPFGVAETLSKAKNTAVNGLVEAGVVQAKAGKVRLVGRTDLPEDWDPATDPRLTVWETVQHLIRKLEQEGESAAAALVHKLGGMAETARDLAYRLYSICERKKWAEEALAYNGLVIAWPELTKLALAERSKARETQKDLDF